MKELLRHHTKVRNSSEAETAPRSKVASFLPRIYWALMGGILLGISQLHPLGSADK